MQRPRFLTSLRVLAAAAFLPILMTPAPADVTCTKKGGACRGINELSVYSGEDGPVCGITQPIVQIESQAFCGSLMADGSGLFLRCGTTSTGFSYAGAVYIHNFGTTSTWGAVLNGACSSITYSFNPW